MDKLQELQQLLKLTQAEIEYSMRDSDESVDQLTESFSGMSNRVNAINEVLKVVREKQPLDSDTMQKLKSEHSVIEITIQQAIMAFQFYDRLTQRLQHINSNLAEVIDIVNDGSKLNSSDAWQDLLQKIRLGYNMEDNRELFDEIMAGVPLQQAIEKIRSKETDNIADDDIELF